MEPDQGPHSSVRNSGFQNITSRRRVKCAEYGGDKEHSRELYDGDNECEMKFGELCHLMKHDCGAVTAASANF